MEQTNTLRLPTRHQPEARAAGSSPAPPPLDPVDSPKVKYAKPQSVADILIRQGGTHREGEWCAVQELKGQEKEIGAQMVIAQKRKRLRKRTKKTKKRNRGTSNAEKKRTIINSARKIARQRVRKAKRKAAGSLQPRLTPGGCGNEGDQETHTPVRKESKIHRKVLLPFCKTKNGDGGNLQQHG